MIQFVGKRRAREESFEFSSFGFFGVVGWALPGRELPGMLGMGEWLLDLTSV